MNRIEMLYAMVFIIFFVVLAVLVIVSVIAAKMQLFQISNWLLLPVAFVIGFVVSGTIGLFTK